MNPLLLYILIGIALILLGILIGYQIKSSRSRIQLKEKEDERLAIETEWQLEQKQREQQEKFYLAEIDKIESKLETHIALLRKEKDLLGKDKEELGIRLAQTETAYGFLKQKEEDSKKELENLQKKFYTEFENLARKIMENNSEKFTVLNKTNIENILNPLKEKLKGFEEKVDKSREAALQRHAELGKQLELLNQQNQKISEEATNLTRALKGDQKTQGNWGEMILEKVLELSGLRKEIEYFTQAKMTDDHGKTLRPDVIVALPGNKKIIIDSKVSLVAYESFINTEDPKEREHFKIQHIQSIKNHISGLGKKNYQNLYRIESPDFVLLFIPIEAAFSLALQSHPQLYNEAFQQQIILVTPTTLLAVLKTIESLWQNEKQKENAEEIAIRAGKLYESFISLLEILDKLGKQLQTVQGTYDSTMKKLTGRGNLIRKVEKLKELGAHTGKQLDSKYLDA